MQIGALGLTFLLVLSGCTTSGGNQETMEDRQYINPVYGWSVFYPRDWTLEGQDSFVKILPPSRLPQGLVGIHSRSVAFQSWDEFADYLLAFEAGGAGRCGQRVQVLSRRSIRLWDGTPVLEVTSLLGTGVGGKSRKIFALVNKQGFAVDAETTVDSWQALEPHFDRIINAFAVRHERAEEIGSAQ